MQLSNMQIIPLSAGVKLGGSRTPEWGGKGGFDPKVIG